MDDDLGILGNITRNHYDKGLLAVDFTKVIVSGRPFGSRPILWKKSSGHVCKAICYQEETRLKGLEISLEDKKVSLINT